MAALNIELHDAQLEVYRHPARFKVVGAGRRFGKSHLAGSMLIPAALSSPIDVTYVAPTFGQARDIMWDSLHEMAGDLVIGSHVNDGWIKLANNRKIHIKGADRPDTMRGTSRAGFVLDEFGDMKPSVWEEIVRPQLSDVQGWALFIGTPKGRNHFYKLAMSAKDGFDTPEGGKYMDPEWAYFHYTTYDNPFIPRSEIEAARRTLSSFAFRQEYMASFEAAASDIFKPEWIIEDENEPKEGEFHIAVDLAGFADVAEGRSQLASLDETAIAVVKVLPNGRWWVKEVIHGRWNIRETALRIVKAYRDYKPRALGIEKGALLNAIGPYLREEMNKFGLFFVPQPLTHGNKAKTDRVVWALQGKLERGQIKFNPGESTDTLVDQLMQFPDSKTHDDLIDALAYVAQLTTIGSGMIEVYESIPGEIDQLTGYFQ